MDETKRLTVQIPKDVHGAVKILAVHRNITVTNLILIWIIEQLKKEAQYE